MRFLFVLIILLSACSGESARLELPDDLIPKDTMVLFIKDLSLIEAHVQNRYLHVSRFHKLMEKSGDNLLKKYHLTRARFESSMDYYGRDNALMRSIYNEALDKLNREAMLLEKKIPLDKKVLAPRPGLPEIERL